MKRCVVVTTAAILVLATAADAARILGLFTLPARSHFNVFSPFLEELARRGHQVTVVSAFPREKPLANYTDIVLQDELFGNKDKGPAPPNVVQMSQSNFAVSIYFIWNMIFESCKQVLKQPNMQKLIHGDNSQFDLIIYEAFFTECTYGLFHKFKVPKIQISSNTFTPWLGDSVGNPNPTSYIPEALLGYSDHMSFKERLINTLISTYFLLFRWLYAIPRMERLMREHFTDPSLPSIYELETNASLLILNSHPSYSVPRPYTPNTIEAGGMHIKKPKPLPKDLQSVLDGAQRGVVYFSLGSNVRSADLPPECISAFLKAFSQLDQIVLWKWEADALPNQPKNVHVRKWLPQNDILAHKNVKLFVTHGGLLSTQESIYHGVPVVAIPFMADQKFNANRAKENGLGVVVLVSNITAESVTWALQEVLQNHQYHEKAQQLSAMFRDRPEEPLETAVFWTEYVLRHNGAPHMRSAALDLNFFQYFLLDVIAFIVAASLPVLAVLYITARWVCRCLFANRHKKALRKKKEQ